MFFFPEKNQRIQRKTFATRQKPKKKNQSFTARWALALLCHAFYPPTIHVYWFFWALKCKWNAFNYNDINQRKINKTSPIFNTNRSFFLPTQSLPPKITSFDPTAHIPWAALGVGHPVNEGVSFSHVQFAGNIFTMTHSQARLQSYIYTSFVSDGWRSTFVHF